MFDQTPGGRLYAKGFSDNVQTMGSTQGPAFILRLVLSSPKANIDSAFLHPPPNINSIEGVVVPKEKHKQSSHTTKHHFTPKSSTSTAVHHRPINPSQSQNTQPPITTSIPSHLHQTSKPHPKNSKRRPQSNLTPATPKIISQE